MKATLVRIICQGPSRAFTVIMINLKPLIGIVLFLAYKNSSKAKSSFVSQNLLQLLQT